MLGSIQYTNLIPFVCLYSKLGESEVEYTVSGGVAIEVIAEQWTILKTRLYEKGKNLQMKTLPEISRFLSHQCPDILSLVDLILT